VIGRRIFPCPARSLNFFCDPHQPSGDGMAVTKGGLRPRLVHADLVASVVFGVLSALINLAMVEAPVARPVAQPA
jgi:hypothetical protein